MTTPSDVIPETAPWSETTFAVFVADMNVGHLRDGRKVLLDYDPVDKNPEGVVCNRISTNGSVCRLWRDHWETDGLPHWEFAPTLIASSGIYVIGWLPS